MIRMGPGDGSGGLLGALGGGGAENKRNPVCENSHVSAQNVFNHVDPIGYSGVVTFPVLPATHRRDARRMDVGCRVALSQAGVRIFDFLILTFRIGRIEI